MSGTGMGHVGTKLPGHPGVACVYGPPDELGTRSCLDVFCSERMHAGSPFEARYEAARAAAGRTVESYLRGEITEPQMRSRLYAIEDTERITR